MTKLLNFGPVFGFELLARSRHWQTYAVRSLLAAGQLAGLALVWTAVAGRGELSVREQAEVGLHFYDVLAAIQLALGLLAAPAATAGTFYFDRARGTLATLLTTDLSASEIVLGKLAARLLPLVGMIFCGLPFLTLAAVLGGVEPASVVGLLLVTLGAALLGCTLALMLSVWGTTLTEVVLATYAIWLVVILLPPVWWVIRANGAIPWPLPDWMEATSPVLLVFERERSADGTSLQESATYLGFSLTVSACLAGVAAWRLRPAVAHESDHPRRRMNLGRLSRWLPGPSLDANPVLWREWHARRPTRGVLILWLLYGALATACTGGVAWMTVNFPNGGPAPLLNALQVAAGMLLLSISASSALAEERVRGSLDVLLATPLPTREVVLGKWWGTFRLVPVLALPPALATAAVAWHHGHWWGVALVIGLTVAYGALLTSLGLGLATWVPRLGRAVGLSVAAHVGITIGWALIAVLLTGNRPAPTAPGLASFSPFVGVLLPNIAMHRPAPALWNEVVGWLVFWILVELFLAGALVKAVLITFDRCLGRMDESPKPSANPLPAWPPIGPQRSSR
jgi:ABC-type transport system involved in multi-copper enzyme maturation permease subunit